MYVYIYILPIAINFVVLLTCLFNEAANNYLLVI